MSWLFLLRLYHSKIVEYSSGELGNDDVRERECD